MVLLSFWMVVWTSISLIVPIVTPSVPNMTDNAMTPPLFLLEGTTLTINIWLLIFLISVPMATSFVSGILLVKCTCRSKRRANVEEDVEEIELPRRGSRGSKKSTGSTQRNVPLTRHGAQEVENSEQFKAEYLSDVQNGEIPPSHRVLETNLNSLLRQMDEAVESGEFKREKKEIHNELIYIFALHSKMITAIGKNGENTKPGTPYTNFSNNLLKNVPKIAQKCSYDVLKNALDIFKWPKERNQEAYVKMILKRTKGDCEQEMFIGIRYFNDLIGKNNINCHKNLIACIKYCSAILQIVECVAQFVINKQKDKINWNLDKVFYDRLKTVHDIVTGGSKKELIFHFGHPTAVQKFEYSNYIVFYDNRIKMAICVCEHLSPGFKGDDPVKRDHYDFEEENGIPEPFRFMTNDCYEINGMDRGHLAPASNHVLNKTTMKECMKFSNIAPQWKALNRGPWKKIEGSIRKKAVQMANCWIICGPAFLAEGKNQDTVTYKLIGTKKVPLPSHFFKCVLYQNEKGHVHLDCFLLRNKPTKSEVYEEKVDPNASNQKATDQKLDDEDQEEKAFEFDRFRRSREQIESLVGMKIFPKLKDGEFTFRVPNKNN